MKILIALLIFGSNPAPEAEILERLVKQLGADSFHAREEATKKLSELGEAARPVLLKNREHKDREVSFRVGRLLQELDGNLKALPPEIEKSVKSESSDVKVSLTMVNRCKRPVRFVWIGFDGKRSQAEEQQTLLQPGEKFFWRKTYQTHAWVVTDEKGNALCVYVIGDENAVIVVNDYALRKLTQ